MNLDDSHAARRDRIAERWARRGRRVKAAKAQRLGNAVNPFHPAAAINPSPDGSL